MFSSNFTEQKPMSPCLDSITVRGELFVILAALIITCPVLPEKVDTPSCSARELSLAAARLDAHLYWSISSRLDEEPTLTSQATKQPDSGSANSKGQEPTFIVGEMTDIQEQTGLGELNGSVATDQSETEA